jgi:iron complex outermembrane receptor protein
VKRNIWLSTAALSAIFSATPSGAQSAPAIPDQVATPAPSEEAASLGDGGIADIVVTAQRRSESVQRTSLSIEVLSAGAAANLSKPSDLTLVSPAVQVATYGSQPQVYVRGIGDQTANSTGQSAVAFSVDGVYFGRPTAVGPAMFDIERVEILKGPQGTLYGRNASGGAVNIITAAPRLERFSGFVSASYGNFDDLRVSAALNLPLGPTLALRLAGQTVDRDGYLSAGGNDEHTKALRGKLLWEPTDALSILASVDWSKLTGQGGGWVVKPTPNGNPWRDQLEKPLPWAFAFNAATAPFTDANDRQVRGENIGASIELNYDLGFATLTVQPAYRHQDYLGVYYSQNFRYAESPDTEQYSAEARLAGTIGRSKWVAGAFYFREDQDQLFTSASNRLSSASMFQKRQSYAAFAEATVAVTESLRVIAGGRYTDERVTGSFVYGSAAVPVIDFTPTGTPFAIDPIKSSKFSYKLGGEFDLGPSSMLFATYATGFKAGGVTPSPRCGPKPFEPENLAALTVGSRNRFFGNKLQVNGEFFHWKYKDQQVAVIQLDPCGDVGQNTRNPGDATITGGNLDVTFQATPFTRLQFAVEYTHSKYDSFLLNQQGAGVYAAGLGSLCSTTARPAGIFDINCAGLQMTRSPEWSGRLGVVQNIPLGGGIDLTFDLNSQFASSRWLDFSYGPNSKAAGYMTLNSELKLKSDKGWSIGAFVNNLTNRAIYTGGFAHTVVAPGTGAPYVVAAIQPPRMYGIRARFDFGK